MLFENRHASGKHRAWQGKLDYAKSSDREPVEMEKRIQSMGRLRVR